jgi:hypothetical protein
MANEVTVTTADRIHVVESIEQTTEIAAEAILAGSPVRYDGTTGKVVNANGTDATEAKVIGIATRSVGAAGMPVTVLKKGTLDGYTFLASATYGANVYMDDTDATLQDDAGGTVDTVVGTVVPGHAENLGDAFKKLLRVNL